MTQQRLEHDPQAIGADRNVYPAGLCHCRRFAASALLLTGDAALQWLLLSFAGTDEVATAYIGPGAGIALVGSFFAVFLAMLSALAAIVTWPLRRIWRAVRGRRALRRAKVGRVIILGLDGLEPSLVERFMLEGALPNMARLKDEGTYTRLGTTWPPLSPVAWSSFTTGTNPGKHNIFDFIARNPRTYLPEISSVTIGRPRRHLKLVGFDIPLTRPPITPLRKSRPFWAYLGDAGIFSAIIRVPITFPPDRFHGVQLAAMCVPDLQGTQGTFTYYCEQGEAGTTMDGDVGGVRQIVERRGRSVRSHLRGPTNTLRPVAPNPQVRFTVEPAADGGGVMKIDGQRIDLPLGAYTPWVKVTFRLAPMLKVRGICKFFLKRCDEPFEMYCTPLQIDPDKPVMPIAHPTVYSSYLSRRQGPFATLGLAEDTWSLSEGLMDEDAFLSQAYEIHEERGRMFFDALDRVRRGLVTCVFDGPDRIQHMFWRFIDETHPARPAQVNGHGGTIRSMYERMDELVGRTLAALRDGDALLVMSDHGFKPFRRCVDLNSWLMENGYLTLKDEARSSQRVYLADVDWDRTQAYAIGLAGLYINQAGREARGCVAGGKPKRELARQIAGELTGLEDPATGSVAVHEAVVAAETSRGPYTDAAPDVIVGYTVGYRVSWDSAVGKTAGSVFYDNTKAWSGDHCVHPDLVPGVLFSNRRLSEGAAAIVDIAPTTLDLLGVERPGHMEGRSLL